MSKSFLFSDSGNQCLRIVTDVFPCAEMWFPLQRELAEAGQLMGPALNAEGVDMHHNAAEMDETIAKLHSVHLKLDSMAQAVSEFTGKSKASLQGPEGLVSCAVRNGICSMLTSLPRMMSRLAVQVSV
jgi:hypothetical protein